MNNEMIVNKNWLRRNWKWFSPMTIVILLFLIILFTSTSKKDLTNIAQAYAEDSLFENAIEKANQNKRVNEIIGKIKPIDKLAILEGNTIYTNDNKAVSLSVRIKGTTGNGKLDIAANKKGTEWEYTKIAIRPKNSNEEINILK